VAATVAAVMCLLVSGCGSGSGGSSAATVSSGTAATDGGTLRIADTSEAETLDPIKALSNPSVNAVTQIIEPLFKANAKGQIEPWLAVGSKQSPDGLTWTFKLRPGVKFTNGKPMTAEDVVFSIEAVRASEEWTSMFEPVTNVRAASASTVTVTTKQPVAGLPAELSLFAAGIVPKDYGGVSESEFAEHPVGTGPFELSSWKHGHSLTLSRNPHYWKKGQPLLDQVVFESAPEVNSRTTQLQGGELDVMASPDWSQLSGLEADPELNVGVYAMGYLDYISLNQRIPLFKDKRVREAVNLALEREGIVKAALYGYGETAGPWIQPAIKGHDESIKPVAQNVAKAKSLLSEAVAADGVAPKMTLLFFSGDTYYSTVAQVAQQDLEEVGFQVTLQPLDESTVISQISAGKYDAVLLYYSSDVADPSEGGSIYAGTEGAFTGGKTEEVESLNAEAGAEADEAKRLALYGELQQVIAREQDVITYDYRPFVWAMQSNVTGFEVNATGHPWLAETGFSE
jgi:peptide/nickel transport system substrate-binding protein